MKATYVMVGNSCIGFKGLLDKLGIDAVPPSKLNKNILNYGVKHSPEHMCLPFKLMLGVYHDALERGADTIFALSLSGYNACRYPDYIQLHEEILKRQGYDFEMLVLSKSTLNQFCQRAREANKSLTKLKFINAYVLFVSKLMMLTKVERLSQFIYITKDKENAKEFEKRFTDKIDNCQSIMRILKVNKEIKKGRRGFSRFLNDKKTIKVGFVGDLFTTVEPFVNFDLVEKMNRQGIFVERGMNLTDIQRKAIHYGPWGRNSFKFRDRLAAPYAPYNVGGLGINSIGDAVYYARKGYPIIHMHAFTCMPELVARTMLARIGKDHNVPVLTFCYDEQRNETAFDTRLETFVDIIKNRANGLSKDFY